MCGRSERGGWCASSTGGVGPRVVVGRGIHAWPRPPRPGPGRHLLSTLHTQATVGSPRAVIVCTPAGLPRLAPSGLPPVRTRPAAPAGRCGDWTHSSWPPWDRHRSPRPLDRFPGSGTWNLGPGTPSGDLGQAVPCPKAPLPVRGRGSSHRSTPLRPSSSRLRRRDVWLLPAGPDTAEPGDPGTQEPRNPGTRGPRNSGTRGLRNPGTGDPGPDDRAWMTGSGGAGGGSGGRLDRRCRSWQWPGRPRPAVHATPDHHP